MTREEAVELVLAGNPWDHCIICKGSGARYEGEGDERRRTDCWLCRGGGHHLSAVSRKAYHMLGINPPPRPRTIIEAVAEDIETFISGRTREGTLDLLKKFGITLKEDT